jgi:DNA mismatch repair protein MutS
LKLQSSFVFATHLHEIVDYTEIKNAETLSLKHLAVVYDRENRRLIYDRKIRDGPGNNMYGLEVCRSLHLPTDFIEMADQIRIKYNPISASLLSLKTSKYNSHKIRNMCEICGEEMSTEVHHLIPQKMADAKGFIRDDDGRIFHKNHMANLKAVCESCHRLCHKNVA